MELESRELISDAMAYAATCHRTQKRKDPVGSPYIFHPTQVMMLLWEVGVTDPVVLAAALLHDTVEDTDATADDIVERFGSDVAGVVAEVTDDKSLPKLERKRLQISHSGDLSQRAKLVKLADKVMNIRDMLEAPPQNWSKLRTGQYIGWASCVVDRLRGAHPELEARFDVLYARADVAPWPDADADVAQ